jgi:hypothetical protein
MGRTERVDGGTAELAELFKPFPGVNLGAVHTPRGERQVLVGDEDRLRHMYIIGKTGTGKTNLLKHMAAQDIARPGVGVCVIDPHGDLADFALASVPQSRRDEVVYLDFSRRDRLPALNPLDIDRSDTFLVDRTVQELLYLFKKRTYHEYTGPRFDEYFRTILMTMLDDGYPFAPSLTDANRLLTDVEFRKERVLPELKSDALRARWYQELLLADSRDYGDTQMYVSSKFDAITSSPILRAVLGSSKATLDFADILDKGKILIVKLPEAYIGKETADFIGSLIVLRLKNAMMRRRANKFFVYIDEFQNFATADFASIVAEARKFGVGFILANQNTQQLRRFDGHSGRLDDSLIEAIWGNIGSTIAFKLGYIDALDLSRHFDVPMDALNKTRKYQAVAKIIEDAEESDSFVLMPPEAKLRAETTTAEQLSADYLCDTDTLLREVADRLAVPKKEPPPPYVRPFEDEITRTNALIERLLERKNELEHPEESKTYKFLMKSLDEYDNSASDEDTGDATDEEPYYGAEDATDEEIRADFEKILNEMWLEDEEDADDEEDTDYDETDEVDEDDDEPAAVWRPSIYDTPISDLDFSVRTFNSLMRSDVFTIGDIVNMTRDELSQVRNVGRKQLDEIIEVLAMCGLKLRGE